MIAIEVKTPSNKKRNPEQDLFLENIRKNGGFAFYATSVFDVQKNLFNAIKVTRHEALNDQISMSKVDAHRQNG